MTNRTIVVQYSNKVLNENRTIFYKCCCVRGSYRRVPCQTKYPLTLDISSGIPSISSLQGPLLSTDVVNYETTYSASSVDTAMEFTAILLLFTSVFAQRVNVS
jgi:hypothetical protein